MERSVLNLHEVRVRPVKRSEEALHRQLMAAHHYLGYLPKIGHTLWYVATYHEQWVALLSFSAAAWKCAVRDRWIGWDFHHQYDYDRLKLIANNSRFLILPDWHRPNLGSKILSLCHRRLASDWQERFGHPLVLLETFVDPDVFTAPSIERPTGCIWADPRLSAHPPGLQQHRCTRPKKCSSNLCKPMPAPCSRSPCFNSLSSRSTQDHVERRTDAITA